jgi:hypothetical protein
MPSIWLKGNEDVLCVIFAYVACPDELFSCSVCSSDDPHQYVDTLVRLFQSVHVLGKLCTLIKQCRSSGWPQTLTQLTYLDNWLRHYHALLLDPHQPNDKKAQLDAVVQKIGTICLALHTTVCGFVIRDLSIMLGKWVKRGGGWVGE